MFYFWRAHQEFVQKESLLVSFEILFLGERDFDMYLLLLLLLLLL